MDHCYWFLGFSHSFIVYSTSKWKLHPFLALLFSAYGFAFLAGMPFKYIGTVIASGFGNLMTNIGLVIVFGTIIGTIIENPVQHCAWQTPFLELWEKTISFGHEHYRLRHQYSRVCDSGFVILSPLNKALAKRAGIPLATMAVALSTGLYATHTLVPPTPDL